MKTISFQVPGTAKPAGSKRAFVNKYTGRAVVVDDCETSQDWKSDVKFAAQAAYKGPVITGALSVCFEFTVKRPEGNYGARGNIKPSAPAWATKRPDLLKLARGIEDAMTGIIYLDDSLIVQEVLRKDYATSKDAFVGVTITIQTLEAQPENGVQKELIPSDGMGLLGLAGQMSRKGVGV